MATVSPYAFQLTAISSRRPESARRTVFTQWVCTLLLRVDPGSEEDSARVVNASLTVLCTADGVSWFWKRRSLPCVSLSFIVAGKFLTHLNTKAVPLASDWKVRRMHPNVKVQLTDVDCSSCSSSDNTDSMTGSSFRFLIGDLCQVVRGLQQSWGASSAFGAEEATIYTDFGWTIQPRLDKHKNMNKHKAWLDKTALLDVLNGHRYNTDYFVSRSLTLLSFPSAFCAHNVFTYFVRVTTDSSPHHTTFI